MKARFSPFAAPQLGGFAAEQKGENLSRRDESNESKLSFGRGPIGPLGLSTGRYLHFKGVEYHTRILPVGLGSRTRCCA